MSYKRESALSGADAKCYYYFQETPQEKQLLTSINSLNLSVHEARGAARGLGYKGVKGYASGIRTIAGSMILQQLGEHPLKGLMDSYQTMVNARKGRVPHWSVDSALNGVGSYYGIDYTNRLMSSLPPFNLIVMYRTETLDLFETNIAGTDASERNDKTEIGGATALGRGASEMIVGVNFVTEAKTISIDDGLIQIAAEFTACDYKPFSWSDSLEQGAYNSSAGETYGISSDAALRAILFGD
tara:strand:- start:435 stop:1160 length:726 start_codon:yes stop_codon:yes gene_type:complete